jgi:hypothetical protein
MKRAGKGIIGMKIFGAGKLAGDVEGSLSFASRLDVLDAFTIGFASTDQIDDVASRLPVVSAG